MKCKDISFGSGACAYAIYLPWKVKFLWEEESQRRPKCVLIDKCLLPEILKLWEMGIKTTGCCCGHGDKDKAFIGVQEAYIPKMKELGYKACFSSRKDSFIPKTELKYN